jgi:hypothetical protein
LPVSTDRTDRDPAIQYGPTLGLLDPADRAYVLAFTFKGVLIEQYGRMATLRPAGHNEIR